MFSKFLTKKPSPLTCRERVEAFWNWYSAQGPRFLEVIDDKRCSDLQPEVSAAVDQWLPHMDWVFGPGKDGHSFTLTGAGVRAKQFVAEYWLAAAPALRGWTFYSSRQPGGNVNHISLDFRNIGKFRAAELWIHPVANEEEQELDIIVWHPLFPKIEERQRWTVIFILLDEALGEYGTQNWIGKIEFDDRALKDSVPFAELPQVVAEAREKYGWEKGPPTTAHSVYGLKEHQRYHGPRGDTVGGTTLYFPLIGELLKAEAPIDHPLPEMGVDLVYARFLSEALPSGDEVAARGVYEDKLDEALKASRAGECLGGALGKTYAYLDFILYDGEHSLEILRQGLSDLKIPGGATVHWFTKDREKDSIRVK